MSLFTTYFTVHPGTNTVEYVDGVFTQVLQPAGTPSVTGRRTARRPRGTSPGHAGRAGRAGAPG